MISGKGTESKKHIQSKILKRKYNTIVNFLTNEFDFVRSDKTRQS